MILLRQKIYSKEEKDEELKHASRAFIASKIAGLGTGVAVLHNRYKNSPKKSSLKDIQEREKITEKLVNSGKKKGIKFRLESEFNLNQRPRYELRGNTVVGSTFEPGIIAHELGHAHYFNDESAGKLGKYAHKLKNKSRYISPYSGIVSGIISGNEKYKAEKEGREENKAIRHSSYLTPLVFNTPKLISEAAASKKGLELLKEAGANKALRKKSAKQLGIAFGTYAAGAGVKTASGELFRIGTYKYRKKREKKDSKKD